MVQWGNRIGRNKRKKGVTGMLLISYILVAGLELAMVFTLNGLSSNLVWPYGFLLLSSLISIPVETSEMGERIKAQLKKININIERYDFLANSCRVGIYILVLTGHIDPMIGVVMAYAVIGVSTLLAMGKLV